MSARFASKKWSVVGGWVDGWMDGWMDGCKSRVKDCLQQSKIGKSNAKIHYKNAKQILCFER